MNGLTTLQTLCGDALCMSPASVWVFGDDGSVAQRLCDGHALGYLQARGASVPTLDDTDPEIELFDTIEVESPEDVVIWAEEPTPTHASGESAAAYEDGLRRGRIDERAALMNALYRVMLKAGTTVQIAEVVVDRTLARVGEIPDNAVR